MYRNVGVGVYKVVGVCILKMSGVSVTVNRLHSPGYFAQISNDNIVGTLVHNEKFLKPRILMSKLFRKISALMNNMRPLGVVSVDCFFSENKLLVIWWWPRMRERIYSASKKFKYGIQVYMT